MEPLEIRVSASTQCNGLAQSIVAAYTEGKEVSLSAIGPQPIGQAVKAVAVANRALASKGIMLVIVPGLITRPIIDKLTQEPVDWVVCLMRLLNFTERSHA